jgi:hypothetical protein
MSVTQQNFVVTCPSCHKRLQVPPHLAGKRAKCSCGQSIAIPTMPGLPAQAAAAATDARSVPLGYRSPVATKDDVAKAQEHKALIRQAVLYSSVLVILILGIFGLRFLGLGHSGASAPALPGEDAMIMQMIRDEDGTEAKEWLAGRRGRMLSGMSETQAENRIDSWYKMGVTKVYAFGGVISMTVALELPPAPSPKRKAIFDWVNQWHEGTSTLPMSDVGQKYVLVRLRL